MRREGLLERRAASWRSDSLDVLRAVLALYVVTVHLAEWGPLSSTGSSAVVDSIEHWTVSVFQSHGETNAAVLAFIVLSGYCIHRNGSRRGGNWTPPTYAIRRFFRIFPVFVIATAFGIAIFLLTTPSHGTLVRTISGTQNITPGCVMAKLTGAAAFAPHLLTCSYNGNAPLNTVMVEIWLYVVYGLVAWLLLRGLPESRALLSIAVVSLGGALFVATHPEDAGWWHNSSLIGYLPYWWIGALAVGVSARRGAQLFLAAGMLWGALTLFLNHASLRGGSLFLSAELRKLAFALAAAGIICLLDSRSLRLPGPLTSIGRSGYSLYAFHAPIIIAFVALGLPWWSVYLAVLSFAAAAYTTIERPVIRLGRAVIAGRHPAPAAAEISTT